MPFSHTRSKYLQMAKWWMHRKDLSDFHEAACYLCLFEYQHDCDKYRPTRYIPLEQQVADKFAANPEFINEL